MLYFMESYGILKNIVVLENPKHSLAVLLQFIKTTVKTFLRIPCLLLLWSHRFSQDQKEFPLSTKFTSEHF